MIPNRVGTMDLGVGTVATVYIMGECRILVSKDMGLWHLSISCQDRYPTWDEIKKSRYDLMPDQITMGMLLPPRDQYVNCHKNTFHLWEIQDEREKGILLLKR